MTLGGGGGGGRGCTITCTCMCAWQPKLRGVGDLARGCK